MHRATAVEPVAFGIVRVTYPDGFSGDHDIRPLIETHEIFAPLRDDPSLFDRVAVGERGHTFGWYLDREGDEIDFCPDSTRMHIETATAKAMADEFRARRAAAE